MRTISILMLSTVFIGLHFSLIACPQRSGGADPPVRSPGMSLRLELFVNDLEKSVAFYTNVLGFERLGGEDDYVPVRSGSVVVGLRPAAGLSQRHYFNRDLQTARRGLGTEIVLEVDDIQAFYDQVKQADGKAIKSPLRRQPWGLTDFRITDPDGYYLRITSR